MALRLETIAIGDELLTGKTSDTNTTFVSQALFDQGLRLERTTVILDDIDTIRAAIKERAGQADYVFCFGGLGPTTDDLTAAAVAEVLNCPVVEFEPARRNLIERFEKLKRPITAALLKQALYPKAADPIPNSVGLAPGFTCVVDNCRFYFLPGVPREMKAMLTEWVLPDLSRRAGIGDLLSHAWRLLGIPESDLQTRLGDVQASLSKDAWLGYRTHTPENHLTLYGRSPGGRPSPAFAMLVEKIRAVVAPWCYAEGHTDLEAVVLDALRSRAFRVATAESCTGGLIAQRLTRKVGASAVVWGGATVYQIEAKAGLLGIRLARPEEAVSAECSRRLAESIREKSGAEVAVAITGSLGPDPANDTDPLGTIYICVVGSGKMPLEQKIFLPVRTREENQWSAASYALGAVLRWLKN